MLQQERAQDLKNQMTAAAYTAWLSGSIGRGMQFGRLCQSLGLTEKPKRLTKEARKRIAKNSQAIAERIIAMDKG